MLTGNLSTCCTLYFLYKNGHNNLNEKGSHIITIEPKSLMIIAECTFADNLVIVGSSEEGLHHNFNAWKEKQ